MASLSHSEQVAAAIVPKISSILSFFAFSYIIQDVIRDPVKRKRTYCRLLFGLCVCGGIAVLASSFTTWPIPAAEQTPMFASGTIATCTAQGFLMQMGSGAVLYSLGLTCYYLLVLIYKWPDRKLAKFERYIHWCALIFAVGTSVGGIPLKLYNNADLWCWISSLPQTCENGNYKSKGEGECERGQNAWLYRWVFFYLLVVTGVVFHTIAMGWLSFHVWQTEKKSQKYSLKNHRLARQGQDKFRNLSRQVFWQSIHYVIVFYISWVVPGFMRMLQTMGKDVPGSLIVFCGALGPMQGFLTFTVYVRPRFVATSFSKRLGSTVRSSMPRMRLGSAFRTTARGSTTTTNTSIGSIFRSTLKTSQTSDPSSIPQKPPEGQAAAHLPHLPAPRQEEEEDALPQHETSMQDLKEIEDLYQSEKEVRPSLFIATLSVPMTDEDSRQERPSLAIADVFTSKKEKDELLDAFSYDPSFVLMKSLETMDVTATDHLQEKLSPPSLTKRCASVPSNTFTSDKDNMPEDNIPASGRHSLA